MRRYLGSTFKNAYRGFKINSFNGEMALFQKESSSIENNICK